jgi:hypothetical protein
MRSLSASWHRSAGQLGPGMIKKIMVSIMKAIVGLIGMVLIPLIWKNVIIVTILLVPQHGL